MKILVICQYYYPEPFRVTDICENLVKRGHQITVITGLPNYPEGKILKEYKKKEHKEEVRNNVRIIRCYEHGRGKNAFNLLWNYFSFAFSGKNKVKRIKEEYDIVLINQLSPIMMAWPGIYYAKKYRKKALLYCYDLWPASLAAGNIKKNSVIYKIFSKISKNVYKNVDKIAVTSYSFIEYLENTHGIDKNKIFYLPQYCEDIFSTVTSRKNDGNFNYVFAGNIGAMQSVETIIKAAKLVQNDKTIKIHIVGEGRNLDNCKKEAGDLNNVCFYGRKSLDEMPYFYSMADAMIITLAKDDLVCKTLPGKVQSYMAAGKPIIGAIDGETKKVIEEAQCGLVCASEDFKSLANLFIKFKSENINLLGENSANYYKNNFSKHCFYNTLEESLNKLLSLEES